MDLCKTEAERAKQLRMDVSAKRLEDKLRTSKFLFNIVYQLCI